MKKTNFKNIFLILGKVKAEYYVLASLFLWFIFSVKPLPFVQCSDGYFLWIPRLSYAANEILNGRIPLWNEFQFCGTTLLADGNTNILNPMMIFYLLIDPYWAYTLDVLLLFVILIAGTWLYFREKGFSKIAAIIGTVGYAFSGQVIFWSLYHSMNLSLALFPLTLFAFRKSERADKRGLLRKAASFYSVRWKAVAFISIFISALGGFIQFAFLAVTAVFAEGIDNFSLEEIKKVIKNRFLTIILGILSASVIIIPTIEASLFSHRKLIPYFDWIMPNGLPLWLMTFWGTSMGQHFYPNYFYYLGIVLIGLAIFSIRKQFKKIFLNPFFVYSLIFPAILAASYFKILPTNFQFGVPSDPWRGMFIFALSLSICAAKGYQLYVTYLKSSNKLLLPPFEFLIIGLVSIFVGLNKFGEYRIEKTYIFLLGMIALCGFALSFAAGKRNYKFKVVLFSTWLVLLLIYNSFWPSELYLSKNVIPKRNIMHKPLQTSCDEGRVLYITRGYGVEDWGIYNGIRMVGGYGSFVPISIFLRMRSDGLLPPNPNAIMHYQNNNNTNPEVLAKYGVLYLVKECGVGSDIEETWQPFEVLPDAAIYKNPKYSGRAYLINKEGSILKKADIVKNTNSYVRISLDAIAGDILVLADSWSPGWKCYDNGEAVNGFDADGFRGYTIRRTTHHEIEWIYRPFSFFIGLAISIISLASFMLLAFREATSNKYK